MAEIYPANTRAYAYAARLLSAGSIIAVPTETVYGLAARADNDSAIAKIYAIKGRQSANPLAVCVPSIEHAQAIAKICPLALKLMRGFWPGPLTIVLPLKVDPPVCEAASAGLGTIGLRMPDIGWASYISVPLALTSANTSGHPSPKTAQAVANDLGPKISLIIDGGPAKLGIDSTVIAIVAGKVKLLRAGAVRSEDFAPYSIEWIS